MSLETQKWLRFITPGILIILFGIFLGRVTGLWKFAFPSDFKEASVSLVFIIPAAVYYLTPLRSYANGKFFDEISENLRSEIVRISEFEDGEYFNWKSVRGVFFSIIDDDKSLERKSRLAYFNGYIWTTVADVRALCIVFLLICTFLFVLRIDGALWAATAFLVLLSLTFPASRVLTDLHKEIGNQQVEIIQHNHLEFLNQKLRAIRDRASNRSSISNS
ncbi:hypothetical protein [Spirulina sp. 06S082]|uniref:hypothetical protein n=1 Tax=Spirulina sp. 06S082 TaxID=3110248 RepID=UPI002B1EDDF3|nr:hypothetical protein [Spirulina sp. 06S082]MEA5470175.1 hypothetical protein [Spirulina sp. 06S082]